MKTKKDKVLSIVAIRDIGGSSYARLTVPLTALRGKKVSIDGIDHTIEVDFIELPIGKKVLKEEMLVPYDILYTNWLLDNHSWEIDLMCSRQKVLNIKDIDDAIVDTQHPYYNDAKTVNYVKSRIAQECSIANMVVTSNQIIADRLNQFNELIHISYNTIPYSNETSQFFYKEKPKPEGLISIGINCSYSHLDNILSLRGVIKKIASDIEIHTKCKFVICGYTKNKKWDSVVSMFKNANPKMEVEVYNALPVESYIEHMDKIDILISPLLPTEFNKNRSALKLGEAACRDVVVIGDRLYSEKELTALLVANSPKDYYQWIKFLIKDDNLGVYSKKLSKQNREERTFEDRIGNLKKAIEFIVNNETHEKPDNLEIYSIIYDENQFSDYKTYFNPINSVEAKSFLFEWNPILDILDNKISDLKPTNYLGIFSWKFMYKTYISSKLMYKLFKEAIKERNVDVISMSPTTFNRDYLFFTNEVHPGFLEIFTYLCNKLGLPVREPKYAIHSNFFLGTVDFYKTFTNTIIKPAIKLLEEDEYLKSVVFNDPSYTTGLNEEELFKRTGMKKYSFHTFLLERLLSVYLEDNLDKFKVKEI